MERHMSNDFIIQQPASKPTLAITARRAALGAALVLAAAALAGCGPDSGAGNASASASAPSGASALASSNLAPSPAPIAPACPKAPAPQCPAPVPAQHAALSDAARRTWSRAPADHHRAAYAELNRRDWSTHRRWTGDHERMEQRDHRGEGLTRGDRIASERDGLIGGPAVVDGHDRFARSDIYTAHGGYRAEEESRAFSGERLIEHAGQDVRGGLPGCPLDCRTGWRGQGHRTFNYAGIDARGYLVWPGKVEY